MASVVSIHGATTNTNLSKSLLQQKGALKIIFNLKRKETVHHLFSDLRILSVYGLFIHLSNNNVL